MREIAEKDALAGKVRFSASSDQSGFLCRTKQGREKPSCFSRPF
ncbi:hypothetical protein [Telmatospirillum sp. J64-1]|nr:hypothetical protein [Telmatospirillum sp. J64-1]